MLCCFPQARGSVSSRPFNFAWLRFGQIPSSARGLHYFAVRTEICNAESQVVLELLEGKTERVPFDAGDGRVAFYSRQ
jgi:hypothetical protein